MVDGKYYFTKERHHRTNPSSDTYNVECENNGAEPGWCSGRAECSACCMLFNLSGAPLTSTVRFNEKQQPKTIHNPSEKLHFL
jgi:hypothetical protein